MILLYNYIARAETKDIYLFLYTFFIDIIRVLRSLDAFPRKGHRRRPRAPRKVPGKSQETPRKLLGK
jgi:hypothetical protein